MNDKSDSQELPEDLLKVIETEVKIRAELKIQEEIQRQDELLHPFNEKFQVIIDQLKSDYLSGDPYAVWYAVYACEFLGANFPDWVRIELAGMASKLIEFEIPNKSYPDYLAKVFKLNGHSRRGGEKKRRDAKVSLACRKNIKKNERRIDIINRIAADIGVNTRQIEKIYDEVKKKIAIKNNNESNRITSSKVKLFSRKPLNLTDQS